VKTDNARVTMKAMREHHEEKQQVEIKQQSKCKGAAEKESVREMEGKKHV
jgi:hypothetical protein